MELHPFLLKYLQHFIKQRMFNKSRFYDLRHIVQYHVIFPWNSNPKAIFKEAEVCLGKKT
jgi:hypothetical protein